MQFLHCRRCCRTSWRVLPCGHEHDSLTASIHLCITLGITCDVLTKAKKWGNSIGLVIPAEVVKKERIRPGDSIELVVRKRVPRLEELGGTLKLRHKLQDLLGEMEEGWDDL
ncbi:MAG: AbrB/MazE/SpoVT family DNA-binding domain-containing protein [Methanobacteriota archaeon]|nr:MAG: AbrB/MazE/SpoVT family DNA-binding domain-containing protein [Euryarchaeota archaeon]